MGRTLPHPTIGKNPGLNWMWHDCIAGNHTENDKIMHYNGISWDGFPSLADLIISQAYFEGKWESNANFQTFSKT